MRAFFAKMGVLAPFLLLAGVYYVWSCWLGECVSVHQWHEVLGYDYGTYCENFRHPEFITYMPFRHPALGFILSPFVAFGGNATFVRLGYAFLGAASVYLIYRLVREFLGDVRGAWLAVFIWLSFGYGWVIVGSPESFCPAMMSLLLSVWLVVRRVGLMPILFASGICGGITLTNGIKPLLGWMANRPFTKKEGLFIVGGTLSLLIAGIAFFALRMALWNHLHPEAPKTVWGALEQTFFWLPSGMGIVERVRCAIVMFFIEPIAIMTGLKEVLKWPMMNASSISAFAWIRIVWAVFCYGMAIKGVVRCWRQPLIRTCLSFLAVDFIIHCLIGWGVVEGQVFAGHWLWMVPIFMVAALDAEKMRDG